MIWITGDYHRDVNDLKNRVSSCGVQPGDTVIVAGDDCTNYYLDVSDAAVKQMLNDMNIDFFFVHGNHQCRPESIEKYSGQRSIAPYHMVSYRGSEVMIQDDYPNLHFAVDGYVYDFEGKTLAVCGGAYSVDKYIRAVRGQMASVFDWISRDNLLWMRDKLTSNTPLTPDDVKKMNSLANKVPSKYSHWWKDEQPSTLIKNTLTENLTNRGWKVDFVVTHTCPLKFEPTERFLDGIQQDIVDKKTEKWLDKIEKKLTYGVWYAGHYHTDKTVNEHFQFLFHQMIPLGELVNNNGD